MRQEAHFTPPTDRLTHIGRSFVAQPGGLDQPAFRGRIAQQSTAKSQHRLARSAGGLGKHHDGVAVGDPFPQLAGHLDQGAALVPPQKQGPATPRQPTKPRPSADFRLGHELHGRDGSQHQDVEVTQMIADQ